MICPRCNLEVEINGRVAKCPKCDYVTLLEKEVEEKEEVIEAPSNW